MSAKYLLGAGLVCVTGFEPALNGLANHVLCRLGYTLLYFCDHDGFTW